MKITPIDIAHKSFQKKMFGLDEAEVLDFLQQTATAMEEVIRERNSLKESVREKELALHEYKEKDQILKSTIATASQMSERFRQDAERESKLIIADAQQKAEIVTRDSRDSLKKLYSEISDLKRLRMQFESNLKALAQAHLSLLEQGDRFMPAIGLNNIQMEESKSTRQTKSAEVSPLTAG